MAVIAQSWEEVGAPYFHNTEVIRALRYAGDAAKFIGAYAGGVPPGGIGSPAYRILTDIFHGGYGDAAIVSSGIRTIITYSFQMQAQYELGNYERNQDSAAEARAENLMTAFFGEELANPAQYIHYNGSRYQTWINGNEFKDHYIKYLLELRKQMIQFHKFCTEYHYIYFNPPEYDWYGNADQEKIEFLLEYTDYREEYVSDYVYEMRSSNYETNIRHDGRGGYLSYGQNTTLSYYIAPGGIYSPGGMSAKKWKIKINDPALELDEMIVVLKRNGTTTRFISSSGEISNPHYLGETVPDHTIEEDKYDVAIMARMRMKTSNKWWVR